MGREIKRVPLSFDWPANKVWKGFINPHYDGHCKECPTCGGTGYSHFANYLKNQWYGISRFTPADTGSVPFKPDDAVVRRRAENAIERSPEYFGIGEFAVKREARRLCAVYNTHWCHHLDADDVAVLLEKDRLWDFTRVPLNDEHKAIIEKKIADGGNSWLPFNNGYIPTPQEVNNWSICGFGHDSINSGICVDAKAKRLGHDNRCPQCKGHGHVWDSQNNRRRAERWMPTEPPAGDGWQLWETVSEGSPISPVYKTPEQLMIFLVVSGYSAEAAQKFVHGSGWAPSAVSANGKFYNDIESAVLQRGQSTPR